MGLNKASASFSQWLKKILKSFSDKIVSIKQDCVNIDVFGGNISCRLIDSTLFQKKKM